MKKCAICTIGDEILIGQIIDTNSAYIAQEMNKIGLDVAAISSFSDEKNDIITNITRNLENHDIVIITGGLGPTNDDITKSCLAKVFGSENFVINEAQLEIIKKITKTMNKDLTDVNKRQASVPEGCEVIPNVLGTAPCIVFRFSEDKFKHQPTLYSMPGVPYEALGLIPKVIKDIKAHNQLNHIYHKTILTYGIGESFLAEKIKEWENTLPKDLHLAYLPNALTGVKLRLSLYNTTDKNGMDRINKEFDKLKPILGNVIYGENEGDLASAIGKLLTDNALTVATAESCTGGKIANELIKVAGASAYVIGGIVAYNNRIKTGLLGVDEKTIRRKGVVSTECAEEMALGIIRLMDTDFAVSTSGIAGPTGETKDKPIGTVCMAVAIQDRETLKTKVVSKLIHCSTERSKNINRFTANALNYLRLEILKTLEK
ncbi:MAG: CinA family nicotinamide mononucleotide deamidase-related protein [Bacteroidales bacterium]